MSTIRTDSNLLLCTLLKTYAAKTNLNVAVIDYVTNIVVVVITAYRYFRFRLRFQLLL